MSPISLLSFLIFKARHISPNDSLLLFNLALVEQRLAMAALRCIACVYVRDDDSSVTPMLSFHSPRMLRDERSSLSTVLSAVRELEMAQRYAIYIHVHVTVFSMYCGGIYICHSITITLLTLCACAARVTVL